MLSRADERAIRRHVGAPDYDRWRLIYTTDDLDDLWEECGDLRLMAAEILTTLATPALEELRKVGDVTNDRRGQMDAYLRRASILRAEAAAHRGLPAAAVTPWGVADERLRQ